MGRKERCYSCKSKKSMIWTDGRRRCGYQTQRGVWLGNDGQECANKNSEVVRGRKELCSKCKAGKWMVWRNGRLRCGIEPEKAWRGDDGDPCVRWNTQVITGTVERCNKCKLKTGTLWRDGQLRCGIEKVIKPYEKPGQKKCNGTGVFVPKIDRNTCCNGATDCSYQNGCLCD